MSRQYYAYVLHRSEINKVTDFVAVLGYGFGKQYQKLAKIYGGGYNVITVPMESSSVFRTMVKECKAQSLITGTSASIYFVNVPIDKDHTFDDIMTIYRKQVDAVIAIMSKHRTASSNTTTHKDDVEDLKQMFDYKSLPKDTETRKTAEARFKVWEEINTLAKSRREGIFLTMSFTGALYKDDDWCKLIDRMSLLWPEESGQLGHKKNLHSLHLWLQRVMLLPVGMLSHKHDKLPIHSLVFNTSDWIGNRYQPACKVPMKWSSI